MGKIFPKSHKVSKTEEMTVLKWLSLFLYKRINMIMFVSYKGGNSNVKFFLHQLDHKQRVIHISSNEVPTQNQLTMGGITHKLIYKLKPFNFINMGQHKLLCFFFFYQSGIISTFILQQKYIYVIIFWDIVIIFCDKSLLRVYFISKQLATQDRV